MAAEQGDGWNAWGADPGALAAEASEVRRAATRHITLSWGGAVFVATDPAHLAAFIEKRGGSHGIIAGVPEEVASRLGALLEAGADELVRRSFPAASPSHLGAVRGEGVAPPLGRQTADGSTKRQRANGGR